jgi:serine acetyltransferase
MKTQTKMNTKLSLLTTIIIITSSAYTQAAEYSPLVFGSTYVSAGASANFGGDIVANTYLVTGASTVVNGVIQTGTAITIGATSLVGSGNDDGNSDITAGTAITIGANTEVDGNVTYGTALTLGAGAIVDSSTNATLSAMVYTSGQVNDAQDYFSGLTAVSEDNRNMLDTTMPKDLILDPVDDVATIDYATNTVVYNASSLTTSAGITLTLEGNYNWVFNITDMMSLGANTNIEFASGSTGSVTWNLGGYASIGAGAEMIGTILAGGYVSTGVDSKVTAANAPSVTKDSGDNIIESYCGGLFSATSYVTLGASGTVSCAK